MCVFLQEFFVYIYFRKFVNRVVIIRKVIYVRYRWFFDQKL